MEGANSLGSAKVCLLPPVGNIAEGFLSVSVRKLEETLMKMNC